MGTSNIVICFLCNWEVLAVIADVEIFEVLKELIEFTISYKIMASLCCSNSVILVDENHEISDYDLEVVTAWLMKKCSRICCQ